MKSSPFVHAVRCLILLALAAGLSCCRKVPQERKEETRMLVAEIHPELTRNAIADLPGPVYQSQKDSPIHWQPWSKETFERARKANRLVFSVWAMPQQDGVLTVLDALAKDPDVVSRIRDNYVPVLLDADAAREMSLLSAHLCAEIRRSVAMPMFVFMSPDLSPVAWLPLNYVDRSEIPDMFDQIDSMVAQTWKEAPEYVMKNSLTDNAGRRERMAQHHSAQNASEMPEEDTLRGIRQLASLYDPTTGNIDEAGGLIPAGAVNLLALAASQPTLPDDLRKRCMESVTGICNVLLQSPLIDPLDGGVFSGRSGSGVTLPSFQRDCATQGRVAVAFLDAYRASGNKALLDAALGMIRFAEDSFATGSGLFCVGTRMPTETKSWLWTVEEVKQLLQPDDAAWWIDVMGMRGLGNIAPEADPNRLHFRNNSLGWKLAPDSVAQKSGLSSEEFEARHARIAQTLLDARTKRIGTIVTPQTAHLPSTLRMVSAFAHAYAVTGDNTYRKKAVDTLNRVRETYWNKASFRLFEMETPAVIGEGRAFHYALALLAAGDVYAITLDETWLQWCEDIATISAERFSGIGFLRESSEASSLMDLPITDSAMLFDESTAGLVSMAEVRLSAGKRPMLKSFSDLAVPLPVSAVDQPILHTDILSSTLARSRGITVLIGRGMSESTRDALTRLPPRLVQRRMALPDEAVADGAVRILGLAAEPLDVAAGMALPLSLTMSQP